MTLRYFDHEVPDLIEEFYQLEFDDDSVPFQSTVLPVGYTHITHLFYGDQTTFLNGSEMVLKNTIISGQFFRSYQLNCNTKSMSLGMSFHPTALHKILNIDISKLDNKHLELAQIHPEFCNELNEIFSAFSSAEDTVGQLNSFFKSKKLFESDSTQIIDKVIVLIKQSEGLISVNDILSQINISQKTLETLFKRIVGLTPGKYIRLYRFLRLMRKYENQEIALKDLIYMFNYYDHSHFSKDFKLFMNESPRTYFKKEYPLMKAVFKNE